MSSLKAPALRIVVLNLTFFTILWLSLRNSKDLTELVAGALYAVVFAFIATMIWAGVDTVRHAFAVAVRRWAIVSVTFGLLAGVSILPFREPDAAGIIGGSVTFVIIALIGSGIGVVGGVLVRMVLKPRQS